VGQIRRSKWAKLDERTHLTIGNTIPAFPNVYHYNYNASGRVTKQKLHLASPQWDFTASYAWDNQGRMTQTYPGSDNFNYTCGSMT
jgi:hypothetical protein